MEKGPSFCSVSCSQDENCIKFDLAKLNVGDGEKVQRTSVFIEAS